MPDSIWQSKHRTQLEVTRTILEMEPHSCFWKQFMLQGISWQMAENTERVFDEKR